MTGFTPQMDNYLIIETGIVQGLGLGLVFVPLSTVAFATLEARFRTDAASLFSLVRNLGSSIGISIVTVVLARNVQINHAELAAGMTPFNQNLIEASPAAAAGDPTALMQIDGLVNIQALMISYVNDFKLMMIVTLCAIPLVLLLSKPARPCGGKGAPRRPLTWTEPLAAAPRSPCAAPGRQAPCPSASAGREARAAGPARKAAIEPAMTAMIALTVTLIVIWTAPSASSCVSTLPRSGSTNCGSSDRYMTATFGLRRLVIRPIVKSLRGPSGASRRTWNGDVPPGRSACQASQSRYERAANAQRVVGDRAPRSSSAVMPKAAHRM